MDTVVLACTHFPLVEDELRAASPQGLHFMHGGDGIARRVQFLTEGQPWPAVAPPGSIVFTRRIDIPPALKQGLGGYGLDKTDYICRSSQVRGAYLGRAAVARRSPWKLVRQAIKTAEDRKNGLQGKSEE